MNLTLGSSNNKSLKQKAIDVDAICSVDKINNKHIYEFTDGISMLAIGIIESFNIFFFSHNSQKVHGSASCRRRTSNETNILYMWAPEH